MCAYLVFQFLPEGHAQRYTIMFMISYNMKFWRHFNVLKFVIFNEIKVSEKRVPQKLSDFLMTSELCSVATFFKRFIELFILHSFT